MKLGRFFKATCSQAEAQKLDTYPPLALSSLLSCLHLSCQTLLPCSFFSSLRSSSLSQA